jgi:hypothetical protein
MFKFLALLFRKVTSILAIAGFLTLPAWIPINGAAALPADTIRLMEGFQPGNLGGVSPLELGVRVTTSEEGWIKRVYFYKYVEDTSPHSAQVWSANGTLLARQNFVDESASGWQSVVLDNPVKVVAGQTFTVSIYGATYAFRGNAFPTKNIGPLTVINGFYKYTNQSEFPDGTVGTNYAVDFNFSTDQTPEVSDPVPGLKVDVYKINSYPERKPDYVLCASINADTWTSVQSINHNFDSEFGGVVAGCDGDFVMIHYTGYLTWPRTETVTLQALADDGFHLTLDGETVIDDWTMKGCSGSEVQHEFIANKPQKLDAWFFEWGGGACSTLQAIQGDQWLPIPKEAFTKNKSSTPWQLPPSAPSVPRNVSTALDGLDITVSWDKPVSDGGSAITKYSVLAIDDLGEFHTCEVDAPKLSCELKTLPAGREYSVAVIAYSDEGRLSSSPSEVAKQTIGTGVLKPVVVAPQLSAITFGQTLSDSAINGGSANVPGSFSFIQPDVQPESGTYSAELLFTPNDLVTYRTETVNVNVQVNQLARDLDWLAGPTSRWFYGEPYSAEVLITIGKGEITYTVVDSAEICSVEAKTGLLTAIRAGECVIRADVPATGNFLATENYKTINIAPVAPGAPGNVVANVSETVATVTWTQPTNDGGSAITGYLVNLTSSDQTKTCTVAETVFTCIFEDLTEGTEYSVEVIALSNDSQLQSDKSLSALSIPAAEVEVLPEPEVTPEPQPEPEVYVDPRPFEAINPVEDDPVGVAEKTVAAITLVSAVAAAGAAVAGAAGAASAAGGAAAGGSSGSSSSSGSSGGARAEAKGASADKANEKVESAEQTESIRDFSKGKFDDAANFSSSGRWGDGLMVWSLPLLVALDNPPKQIAKSFARVLPIGAKIFSDGAYLRAMIGSFSALLVVISVLAGAVGVTQTGGLLVLPSTLIIALIVVIGAFDVLAGFLGAATLAMGLAITAGLNTPADIRFLFGVIALGVVPRVISGAFRSLRREVTPGSSYAWERLLDYFVAPMLAAWASYQIIGLLPILAGIALPVEELGQVIPIVVAIAMIFRVTLEELAGRYFPDRTSSVQVQDLPKPPTIQLVISTILRAAIFSFIAAALIGVSWHLFVGAFIFVLPNLLALFQSKFPNSRKLYHLMPQGLVNLCVSLWLGQVALMAITGVFQETPDLAKIGFVLLPIPSLILSILKLFGRHGAEGEPRFYEKPNMGWFYRIGTLLMIFLTAELTNLINTTTLI